MKVLMYFVIACATGSCTHVMFDVPQPRNAPELKEFPEKFRGLYLHEGSEGDSLRIGARTVVISEFSEKQIPQKSIDTIPHLSIRDGLIYDTEMPELGGLPFTIEDSLIKYRYVTSFTMGLSDTFAIKKLGSKLVANMNFDDEEPYWDVYLVGGKQSGDLVVYSIGSLRTPDADDREGSYDGDLEEFAKIAPYEKVGENTYLFKPDKKQFAKLVKKGLFSEKEIYKRLE